MKKFGIIVAGLLFAVISSASASSTNEALMMFATDGLYDCQKEKCGAQHMIEEFNEDGVINGFGGQGLGRIK